MCTCLAPIEDCRSRGDAFIFCCGVDCLSIRMLSSGEPCTPFLRISADAGLDMLKGVCAPQQIDYIWLCHCFSPTR